MNPESLKCQGPIVVAVSGGIDSCVLLHKIHFAALLADVDVIVVHVDHGLRSDSSLDANFVLGLARDYGRPVFVKRIQVRKSNSVQAQARIQRYAAISHVAHAYGTRRVATGHHAQDQDENRALRSAIGRFGDLQTLRDLTLWNIELWRPMLSLRRAEIESYARKHDLQWREDPSNASPTYSRNALRQGEIPLHRDREDTSRHQEVRRLTAHRWWVDGHDSENLRRACNMIPGVRITRRAIEASLNETTKRVFTQGAVVVRHPDGFEMIRSTCQGDRVLPIPSRTMESRLDFGILEF